MSESERHRVAIAILHQNGKFLLQLRDDIPGIFYPGHWALFGGHIEPGESPDAAIRRELLEEISYAPDTLTQFDLYEDTQVVRYVYHGELSVALSQLVLGEGWDMALATPEEIGRGDRYSQKADQVRPLGKPHQRILLDFIECNDLKRNGSPGIVVETVAQASSLHGQAARLTVIDEKRTTLNSGEPTQWH